MNILPRLLYLFQALPIWIPPSMFKNLDKMISTFIWQGKKPRIRKKLLNNSKEDNGLSLPNFKFYYWAAQLRGLTEWIVQDQETNWITLENNASPSVPLETAIFLEQKKWKALKIENEWMACTHRIWTIVRKKLGLPLATSRALQIAKLTDFPPNKVDSGFSNWAEKGLITLHQLFDGEVLKSFEQLQHKYRLCPKEFYRYLQIRDYVKSRGEWESLQRLPSSIEAYFIRNINEKKKEKIVSKMYNFLQTQLSDNSFDIKNRWELEANIIIEDEDWKKASEIGHKTTNSPIWKEFGWKVRTRFFRTPLITFSFDKNRSNLCWRSCNLVGDHTHIFWDCPILKPFWRGVLGEIQNMLKCTLSLDLAHCILGLCPREDLGKNHVKIIHILLLVARKMITKSWLKVQPPTIEQWHESLKNMYYMEKITAQLHLKTDQFSDLWDPVICHFGWPN